MKINIDSNIFGEAMKGQPEAIKVLQAAARTARIKEKMASLKQELFMVELAEERAMADYQRFVNGGRPEGDETMAAEYQEKKANGHNPPPCVEESFGH